jgi:iron complex transport system ATP-binding protein
MSVKEVLCVNTPSEELLEAVTAWLNIDCLDEPFSQQSQGMQKLILFAAAIASRPSLLVLDEPCQGLDLINRRKLLGLCERLCEATDVTMVYITHHYEEVFPSISHALHLVKGKAVYNGKRQDYNSAEYTSENISGKVSR